MPFLLIVLILDKSVLLDSIMETDDSCDFPLEIELSRKIYFLMRTSPCADVFVVVVSWYVLQTFFESAFGQTAAAKGNILQAIGATFLILI